MPTYDFKCRDCGEVSEVFVRSFNSKVRCPKCGGENMERLFSSSFKVIGPTVGVPASSSPDTTRSGLGRGLGPGRGLGRGRGRGWRGRG